jgi:hypothetical protein
MEVDARTTAPSETTRLGYPSLSEVWTAMRSGDVEFASTSSSRGDYVTRKWVSSRVRGCTSKSSVSESVQTASEWIYRGLVLGSKQAICMQDNVVEAIAGVFQ